MTLTAPGAVILVDDDPVVRAATAQSMELADIAVQPFSGARRALGAIDRSFNGVIVSDIRMPEIDGLQFFKIAREIDPTIPFILITGHGDIPMAVNALQQGADDFIPKPFANGHLIASVRRALSRRQLELDNRTLRALVERAAAGGPALIGETPAMVRLRDTIDQVAATKVDVLIEGEAGVGKELAALLLHRGSSRRSQAFVGVTCDAGPQELVARQLFGEGRPPPGGKLQIGQVQQADRGTLFLDAFDRLSDTIQRRLLNVIEDRLFYREGEDQPTHVDVRVIAATRSPANADPHGAVVRDDLLHALNVVRLRIPPLRERRPDIPLLFAHFIDEAAAQLRRRPAAMTEAVRRRLLQHDWPGNVRELRSFAFRSAMGVEDANDVAEANLPSLPERVGRFEAYTITSALEDAQGSVAKAIRRLGIPRKTFYDKIHRHGIEISRFRK